MNIKIFIIIFSFTATLLLFSFFAFKYAEAGTPDVLKCQKDCGTVDVNNEFSFQARLMKGSKRAGCNVTFIEDDIILTAAHCFDIKVKCCDSEKAKKKSRIWEKNKKELYVVDGKNFPDKKIIVAKVLDISARFKKGVRNNDLLIAHVDRNCEKCKGNEIVIKPIPIANSLPPLNTKALHIVAPENSKQGKGRIYIDHLLNSKIIGVKKTPNSIQVIIHDGKSNPPMLFGASGSPVIFKECGNYVVHGLHGNGIGEGKIMHEYLKLLQTQKKWIQSEIYKWTGRTYMIDSCSETGRRSFMPDQKFDVLQNECS